MQEFTKELNKDGINKSYDLLVEYSSPHMSIDAIIF
jgi:hypothetical protein